MNIDLGGSWWAREALGDTWRWYLDKPLPTAGNNVADAGAALAGAAWMPAQVPGSVTADLVRAGLVADPNRAMNSKAAEWVAARSWVYRRTFTAPALATGQRAMLHIDGVDPGAAVFVDGQLIGEVTGIFGEHVLDVTEALASADDGGAERTHQLSLVLPPAPASEPQVGRTDRVRVHSPRMTYGWDFCPRLVHQGIWRGIGLRIARTHVIRFSARPVLAGDVGRIEVSAQAICGGADGRIRVALLDGETECAAVDLHPGVSMSVTGSLTLPNPDLWSPQDPHCYQLVVTDENGEVLSRQTTGFRTVEFTANPGAPEGAAPFTVIVNGHACRAIGWNWVPARAQFGEITEAEYRHLLGLAKKSGAVLLRVWGGGLIETPTFYRLADELGLLVWQEFAQSSSGIDSTLPADAEYVAMMVEQAEQIVPRLVHHPCLVMWCGGNELDVDARPATDAGAPVLAALHAVIDRLDPGRHWAPSSPQGPQANNRLEVIEADPDGLHDVHGPWEHQGLIEHYRLANAGTCLAHTEFGVEGMANARTLEHLLPPEHRWPVDRSNPYYEHAGAWWNNAALVDESFGRRLSGHTDDAGRANGGGDAADAGHADQIAAYRRASQLLQASGLAYAVEADLRRAPRCSMVLPWQLNEPFPNAWCTAVVDARGDTKPAYHALARAFAPRRVSVRVDRAVWAGQPQLSATAWLWAYPQVPAGSLVRLDLCDLSGRVLAHREQRVHDAVHQPVRALELIVDHPGGTDMVIWRASWTGPEGRLLDTELMLAGLGPDFGPLLDAPRTDLRLEVTRSAREWSVAIRNIGPSAAIGVQLLDARPYQAPGWAVIDGDVRALLPGEQRRLGVVWDDDDGAAADRTLTLEGWNFASHTVN